MTTVIPIWLAEVRPDLHAPAHCPASSFVPAFSL
jgi:hypothetical protein